MNIKQITDSLNKIYQEENTRIVFWYDTDGEFEEIISSLELEDVSLVRLDKTASLELKIRLEMEDTENRYLLYSPCPEPAHKENWLLDIQLYSHLFHADKASLILNDLGLSRQSMRAYCNSRKTFFNSKERTDKLKKWVKPEDNEEDLDLKMLGVITRVEQPDAFVIFMKLFAAFCEEGNYSPDNEPKIWLEILKLDLEKPFWDLVARTFGYAVAAPSLSDLLIRLLVTDFVNTLKDVPPPAGLEHFVLQAGSQSFTISVFLSQWRNDISRFQAYNRIADHYSRKLKIAELIQEYERSVLLDVMTFEVVEKRIVSDLRDVVLQGKQEEFETIEEHIQCRRDGYWVTTGDARKNLYGTTFDALESAMALFRLRRKYDKGLSYPGAEEMFSAYTGELYLFDQYYRHFHEAAGKVELAGWDILKTLQVSVEDCYSGWFLDQLALAWDGFLERGDTGGLLRKWTLFNVKRQDNFYKEVIKSPPGKTTRVRTFVIISDALRYEIAEELAGVINSQYRLQADLSAMLGVLPSYTALGMAALLPHKSIAFTEMSDGIVVDGQPCAGFEQRGKILAQHQGVAVKAEDLLGMSKAEGREFVKPFKSVYIYHNTIDATGDTASTELKTFEAVRQAIDELNAIIRYSINSLSAGQVHVTADHGFIYQDKAPDHLNKSVLDAKPGQAVKSKKRYILGRKLEDSDNVWHGNTRYTAGTEDDMEFWLPRGTNRFHFSGGSRFIHGGAMLQEVVVPLLTVTELKGAAKTKSEVRKVGISRIGSQKKVVTNIHRFEFIQTDSVSDRMKPIVLTVSLRDGNELVSNEAVVTFDSSSTSMDERKKSVKLILKGMQFDRKKEYYLVLRDQQDDTEYERSPVHIDLAFSRDF
ncbi:BREX-1 system phosphatase PglZ type A [Desulforhopalus vacuolatus]|uniref:BREX-1 system phosphatase PglZ type A n=1 Tax=Desulforhopalus vacuolatus TaxID=40414 RepID=UPI001963BC38|nr:BREX-1 system phosphatase PglZ type A [Desulforhopalus vacuolatus]MBM9521218.1 BREX-1 system phosphatase PglZ type A [Desulforhopalus vacuolatus]